MYIIFNFLFNIYEKIVLLGTYISKSIQDISVCSPHHFKKNLSLETNYYVKIINVPDLKILSETSIPSNKERSVAAHHTNAVLFYHTGNRVINNKA